MSNTQQHHATTYTGDIVGGIPVITHLNLDDLEAGKIYRFMFQGSNMNIGQHWYVPVMVAKGSNPGKKLLLNTGIHGDELNGSRVIQQLFATLDATQLSGSIIGVIQAAPNSLFHISRTWYSSTDSGEFTNMNGIFPGDKNGNSAQIHAYLLWNHLWHNNCDYAIDLHSQSTDTEYPLFVFADYRNPEIKTMAELIPADQIKIDEGEKGTVETTFVEHGIPAITIEIGAARSYQSEYINRTLEGIKNILNHLQILNCPLGRIAASYGSFIGNQMHSVKAATGGYAEVKVNLGDNVVQNQEVALQRNAFGDVIHTYLAPVNGRVLSVGTGATREAGSLLVRILYNS